jgi:peptidyl-prolyl cis-trans isomerase-like 2
MGKSKLHSISFYLQAYLCVRHRQALYYVWPPTGREKLIIDRSSEWSGQVGQHGAASGIVARKRKKDFKRLPFTHCALSLQPFEHPVCTPTGTIFDIKHIIPWLKKHGTNPVTGEKLDGRTLITLKFDKNEEGEYVDPVTKKVFTDFSKLVAIKTSGRVYLWDTVEQLNLKAKNLRDLVSDEEFTKGDLIILQDPMDLDRQNISAFKNLQDEEKSTEGIV